MWRCGTECLVGWSPAHAGGGGPSHRRRSSRTPPSTAGGTGRAFVPLSFVSACFASSFVYSIWTFPTIVWTNLCVLLVECARTVQLSAAPLPTTWCLWILCLLRTSSSAETRFWITLAEGNCVFGVVSVLSCCRQARWPWVQFVYLAPDRVCTCSLLSARYYRRRRSTKPRSINVNYFH